MIIFALSIIIFLSTILLLGIPFTQWGFLHDDFGVIWHSQLTHLGDFLKLFSEPGMTTVVQPSNYIIPEQSFFAVLYRPFSYIFYGLQWQLFGFDAYKYLLVTIIFHAINSVILFKIFLHFTNRWLAFFCAMLFAFHLSHWDWLGWIAGQMHVINLTLILLTLLLFKKYLDDRNILFYILSCLVYGVSLFTRETAIILPLWLFITLCFYWFQTHKIRQSLWATSGFLLTAACYMTTRIVSYPLKTTGEGLKVIVNPVMFFANLKNRFFDLVTFLVDLANIVWIPGGNRMLKGSLLLIFFAVMVHLALRNKKKGTLLFFAVSMLMFMWPALLRYYSSRYVYKALPFFMLAVIFLIEYYPTAKNSFKKIALSVLSVLLVCNIALLTHHFGVREKALHKTARALDVLAHSPAIHNRIICFVGLPYDIFPSGVAQALWIHGGNPKVPVYYDNSTFIWSTNRLHENYLSIQQIPRGLNIMSLDGKKAWFWPYNKSTLMGSIEINERDTQTGNIMSFDYIFDTQWLNQDLLFVTWDYPTHAFKIFARVI